MTTEAGGRPGPDAKTIARAWELSSEGRSVRYIGEALGVAASTAADYVKRGRAAEVWTALHDVATERDRTRVLLDTLLAWGADRYKEGGDFESVAPVILKIVAERNRLLGLYAPQRVSVSDDRTPPEVDAATVAAIRALQQRAAEEDRLLGE